MDKPYQEKQGLTKAVAVFIGWLSGSLGGIAAILYACGYLLTIAQLNMLGLSGLVAYGHEHYLAEGGRFLIAVTGQIGEIVLNLLLLTGVLCLPLLLLLGGFYVFRRASLVALGTKAKNALMGLDRRFPGLWRTMLYGLLLAALLAGAEDPQAFNDPLESSGLLFAASESARNNELMQLMINGDDAKLTAIFANSLLMVLKVFVLLFLAWEVSARWRLRLLYISPFVIIFLLYALLLPMLYGVLQRQIRLPVVEITLAEALLPDKPEKLFLLNKTEREFVLWEAATRRVLWVPAASVKLADIRQMEPLFSSVKEQP
jgi:hypothetical protein